MLKAKLMLLDFLLLSLMWFYPQSNSRARKGFGWKFGDDTLVCRAPLLKPPSSESQADAILSVDLNFGEIFIMPTSHSKVICIL